MDMEESRKLNDKELIDVAGGEAEAPPCFTVGLKYLHKYFDDRRFQITKYLGYSMGDHWYRYDEQEYKNYDPRLTHPYPGEYRWYVTHADMEASETYLKDLFRK